MAPGHSCCGQLLFFSTISPQIRSSRSRRIYQHVPLEPLGRPSLSSRFAGSRFYDGISDRSLVSAAIRLPPLGKQCQAARNIQVVYFFWEPFEGVRYLAIILKHACPPQLWRLDLFGFLSASQTPGPSAKFGPDPQNCSNSCRR